MRNKSLFNAQALVFVVVFAMVFMLWSQPHAAAAKYSVPKNHKLNSYEKKVIQLVNKERKKRNLKPLKTHNPLSYVSRTKSADMRDQDYFDHKSPKYGSPKQMVDDHGINYHYGVAENIAVGYKTPKEVVKGWMKSDEHRRNILDPLLTHIGVGYVKGGRHGTYWTQIFIGK